MIKNNNYKNIIFMGFYSQDNTQLILNQFTNIVIIGIFILIYSYCCFICVHNNALFFKKSNFCTSTFFTSLCFEKNSFLSLSASLPQNCIIMLGV